MYVDFVEALIPNYVVEKNLLSKQYSNRLQLTVQCNSCNKLNGKNVRTAVGNGLKVLEKVFGKNKFLFSYVHKIIICDKNMKTSCFLFKEHLLYIRADNKSPNSELIQMGRAFCSIISVNLLCFFLVLALREFR